jgi:hypothetical protein
MESPLLTDNAPDVDHKYVHRFQARTGETWRRLTRRAKGKSNRNLLRLTKVGMACRRVTRKEIWSERRDSNPRDASLRRNTLLAECVDTFNHR